MDAARKVTVELPEDLLQKAQRSTGKGITATIRQGLELVVVATRSPVIAVDTSSWIA